MVMSQADVIWCAQHTAAHKSHAGLIEAYIGAEVLLHHAREERDRYKALYERARKRQMELERGLDKSTQS